MFRHVLLASCLSFSTFAQSSEEARSKTNTALEAPASAPASQIASAPSNQPAPSAQCEDCFTPLSLKPMHRASLLLGGGGLVGLVASGTAIGALRFRSPAMTAATGLGIASMIGVNTAIGTLGWARYQDTGKLRPLLISTAASSGALMFQFVLAIVASINGSYDEFEEEEFVGNDIDDSLVAMSLVGAAAAAPVSVALLFKTTKEAIKKGAERQEQREPRGQYSTKKLNHGSMILAKAWAIGATSAFLLPMTAEKERGPNVPLGVLTTTSSLALTSSTLSLLLFDFHRHRRERPRYPLAIVGALAAQTGARALVAVALDNRAFDVDSRFNDMFYNESVVFGSGAVLSGGVASLLLINAASEWLKEGITRREGP